MHIVRKPKLTEVVEIKQLLDTAAEEGRVLPRELRELYENVRDFYVYKDENGVGGCVAMHIDMVDLAEVRSLVVRGDLQGKGIGRQLVNAVIEEARRLEIARVYALTREPLFFARNGFRAAPKEELPYKVFKDCMRCPRFDVCDETAMIKDLTPDPANANSAQV